MQEYKNKIEAILFATGRSFGIKELAELCGIGSIGIVKDALKELKNDYNSKDSALEIVEENSLIKLAIRSQYQDVIHALLPKTEMDKPLMETLSVIAWKQPIIQADVVKVRGTTTYEHVKILKELNYVESEKFGRTRKLKLTSKFYDYFDVSREELKEKFKDMKEVEENLEKTAQEKKTYPFTTPLPEHLLQNEKTSQKE